MHPGTKIYIHKYVRIYLLKTPFEILTSNALVHLNGQGLSLEDWLGVSAQDLSSAFSGSPSSIVNMRVGELRDVSHSEGDAGHSPLRFGKTQRVSPRATVYMVPKQFAFVISKFLSWPQYRSIITVIFKSPVTMVRFHSGYKLGTE